MPHALAWQLISTSSSDLLFLSDLRIARSNIGQTRRILKTALLGGRTMLTSIGQSCSRDRGMGARH